MVMPKALSAAHILAADGPYSGRRYFALLKTPLHRPASRQLQLHGAARRFGNIYGGDAGHAVCASRRKRYALRLAVNDEHSRAFVAIHRQWFVVCIRHEDFDRLAF
jgi:hypothetical protein